MSKSSKPTNETTTIPLAQAVKRVEAACRKGGLEAGLYCHMPLIPIGGYETKVKPPTYIGKKGDKNGVQYPNEERYVGEQTIPTVYLSTVQDAANRMETALVERFRNDRDIQVPNVDIICEFDGKTRSIYHLPHRYSDFHLKDSLLLSASFKFDAKDKNQPFRNTAYGRDLYGKFGEEFNEKLLMFSPVSILFGAWNSFGDKARKEVMNKQHRCVQCETVAIKVGNGIHTHSRIDPIITGGEVAFRGSKHTVKASEAGGGYFPPTIERGAPGGVSVSRITENWSLYFQALLRYSTARYQHGQNNTEFDKRREHDAIAREMLTWLAIAMHMFRSNDYFYRSGCSLQRLEDSNTYVFSKDNAGFVPTEAEVIGLYNKAAEKLEKVGRYDRNLYIELQLDPAINKLAYQQMTEPTKADKKKMAEAEARTNKNDD